MAPGPCLVAGVVSLDCEHPQKGGGDEALPEQSSGKLTSLPLANSASTVQKAIADGAEVAYLYPEDGTSAVSDGIAILKDAPHRGNAEKFVDFMLGWDAQSFLCETIKRRPVRGDITIQGESKLENLNLIDYDLNWAAREKNALVALWQREYEAGGGDGA